MCHHYPPTCTAECKGVPKHPMLIERKLECSLEFMGDEAACEILGSPATSEVKRMDSTFNNKRNKTCEDLLQRKQCVRY